MSTMRELLRTTGPINLDERDSASTPGFDGDKKDAKQALIDLEDELRDSQECLFARGRAGSTAHKVLLVLQGMDTAGKGGTIRKAVGLVDPQGIELSAFKKPTPEELKHDFLWRIAKRLPAAGMIGVFDRSHYEDVLIGRVRELAPGEEIERRYGAINDFEREFVNSGGHLIKCFLHISADDQAERLAERLDDPTKYWKFNPGDIDERALWPAYQEAYEIALEQCSTEWAPWYVVPSGHTWYRNWAVSMLLLETLRRLELEWPGAEFDVEEQKARLKASRPAPGADSTNVDLRRN